VKTIKELLAMKPPFSEKVLAVVDSVEAKKASNNNDFVAVALRDKEAELRALMFDTNSFHKPGTIVEVSLEGKLYKGNLSFQIKNRMVREDLQISQFERDLPVPLKSMVEYLERQIVTFKDMGLQNICKDVVRSTAFQTHPAAQKVHSNFKSGLIYHVYRILLLGGNSSRVTNLNWQVFVAAAIFHDIGKLEELDFDGKAILWNKPGSAFGHLYMGAAYFTKRCKEHKVEEKLYLNILHCLLSHHGEHGEIMPATIEALVFHAMDLLESRIAIQEFSSRTEKSFYLKTTPIDNAGEDVTSRHINWY